MKRVMVVAVVLVLGGIASLVSGGTLTLIEDGYIHLIHQHVNPEYTVITDYGVSVIYYVGNGTIQADRGFIEYDLLDIADPMVAATLTIWQLDREATFTRPVYLYAYEGDRQITVGDFYAPGTLIATLDFPTGYNFGVGVPFDTDVLPTLRTALAEGWGSITFRLQSGSGLGTIFYTARGVPGGTYFGGQPPRLSYEFPSVPPAPGDGDADGLVDSSDLAAWQRNYDALGVNRNTYMMGDWNRNGAIDSADLALWQQNYLAVAPLTVGATHVPEPGTLALLALGGLAVLSRRRRLRV